MPDTVLGTEDIPLTKTHISFPHEAYILMEKDAK